MERVTLKRMTHSGATNGALLKKVIRKNMPANQDIELVIGRLANALPAVGRFLKANWKPIAIATTAVAVVSLGAYTLLVSLNSDCI